MDYMVLIMVNNYSYLISTIMILTVIVIANVQKNVFFGQSPDDPVTWGWVGFMDVYPYGPRSIFAV